MDEDDTNTKGKKDNNNTNDKHKIVFNVLEDNFFGEITLSELGKFLRQLFKEQIKELQESIEQ